MPGRGIDGRTAISGTIGGLIGFLGGLVLDGAAWLWVFAAALDGDASAAVPPIVRAEGSGETAAAVGGPGLLVLPVGLAVVGALVLGLLATRREPRNP